jgi:flagellar protein FlaG
MITLNNVTNYGNYRLYGGGNESDIASHKDKRNKAQSIEDTLKKELKEEVSEAIKKREIERQKIDEAIKTANKLARLSHIRLQFKLHKETGYVVVKMIDIDHDKVIKEIPPEKLLDILSGIGRKMVGLFVDNKV